MSAFRVVGRDPVWDAGWLGASELRVRGGDGEEFTRTVVHHPGAVVVVPLLDERTALVVRQFRAAVGGDVLEVPAGKRDVDGEPPETTAARELEEELGRTAGRIVPLAEFYNSPGFCDEHSYCFAALDVSEAGAPRPVGPEERALTVEPVLLADVEELVANRHLVDAKSIIGLLLARALVAGTLPPPAR